jgi:chitinase
MTNRHLLFQDIYARKYFPQQIPASQLTHLLYAFADTKPDGTIFLTDTWADTDIHYAGDSWSDSGKNVYGAMKQLGLLKQKNRNLKVLLSIGGWTYTNTNKHMDPVGATDTARQTFAKSCVDLISMYGFDGIDVDWEYPQTAEQGSQFLELLKVVRRALDALASQLVRNSTSSPTPQFLLSIAAPAGETNYKHLPLKDMVPVLDMINLMAYDYAGSWDNTTGHASNLYHSKSNPTSTPYNTDDALKHYLQSVPPHKLNLGMPLYGRAFTSTSGLGQPYNGVGKGSWEAGVYDAKDMPLNDVAVLLDKEAGATYSFDNATGMLVSFDSPSMARTKAEYIAKHGLGGAMWWEVSGDGVGNASLIATVSCLFRWETGFKETNAEQVVDRLGGTDGKGMESSSNWLRYPGSPYDNLKSGFAAPASTSPSY